MEAVALSMTRIVGWRRRARARQVSWHWPREKGQAEPEDMGIVSEERSANGAPVSLS